MGAFWWVGGPPPRRGATRSGSERDLKSGLPFVSFCLSRWALLSAFGAQRSALRFSIFLSGPGNVSFSTALHVHG